MKNFSIMIYKMQENSKVLYKIIGKMISETRKEKGIKYTDFCYENEIPMSTYDDIVKGRTNASFYNIFRVISALGLSFEEFGKMLDSKLPENFLKND